MRSWRRAPNTTLAPRADSSLAVASPSPLLAPVMTTTFVLATFSHNEILCKEMVQRTRV
jgi:hypothetical protein